MANLCPRTVVLLLVGAAALPAQRSASDSVPTNTAPNPYQTVVGWARLPDGRPWGSTSAVAIDRDGVSVWVAERCGANSCANSDLPSVLKFDSTGTLVRAFGAGLIQVPHGLHVDRHGNVWVTDSPFTRRQRDTTKGHQVLKFAPDGTLLLTLGRAGGAREPDFFFEPNAVVTAPNGDIYVAEGHSDAATANARIVRFTADGKFKDAWGRRGHGVGELLQPHALAMDSRGRLFIGDRSNNRILILDQNWNILDTWYQFSRPSGIYIDANDVIYVADSESGSVEPSRPAWMRGIRIGSARDGRVHAFIPDPTVNPPSTSGAEGVAADARGNVYGAEVGQKALKRYVRKP